MYGITPFFVYQYMGYTVYCRPTNRIVSDELTDYGKLNNFHLPNDKPSEWCYYNIPFSYDYIQRVYWNVGLFSYFQLKQIPNFLLALPVIVLSLYSIYRFTIICVNSLVKCKFNIRVWISDHNNRFLPYILHLTFLLLFGVANAHIQILTRMLYSSSPLLYICISREFSQAHTWGELSVLAKGYVFYSLLFVVLGTAMHSNFFPWT